MKERNNCKLRENKNSSNLKAVGLGILVDHRSPEPNLVVKQSRKLAPSLIGSTPTNSNNNPCFLKTCFLCHKNLDPQEDIYMYRYLKLFLNQQDSLKLNFFLQFIVEFGEEFTFILFFL